MPWTVNIGEDPETTNKQRCQWFHVGHIDAVVLCSAAFDHVHQAAVLGPLLGFPCHARTDMVCPMGSDLFGQVCALSAAMTWAVAVVLFKRSGEQVPPLSLNLFKNVLALVMLIATLAFMGEGFEVLSRSSRGDIYILMLSGFLGIALADTLFFHSLNLIGVGLVSIVDCLYSPMIIFFAVLLLKEDLATAHYVGTAFVLSAVFLSSRHAPPPGRTRGQLVLGILLGAVAIILMAFGIVLARPVLRFGDFPLIWATTLRLFVGTAALVLFAAVSRNRKKYWSVFRPSPIWWSSVPASILGAYFAMIFWVAGFKYADKSAVAGMLNQMSAIFAIILAAIFLKERFTMRKLIAVIVASTGVVVMVLAKEVQELLSRFA